MSVGVEIRDLFNHIIPIVDIPNVENAFSVKGVITKVRSLSYMQKNELHVYKLNLFTICCRSMWGMLSMANGCHCWWQRTWMTNNICVSHCGKKPQIKPSYWDCVSFIEVDFMDHWFQCH